MDLLCVGDVMVDVHAATGMLAEGGDVHGRVVIRPGGTSANAAVWAVASGASAGVVGRVGTDLPGELCVRALRAAAVDTSAILSGPQPTGAMLILFDEHERSMAADRGANTALVPADLPSLDGVTAILVSGYLTLQDPTTPAAVAAIEAGVRAGALVAVEAASWPLIEAFGPERFFEVTRGATAIVANEDEARALTGLEAAEAAGALGERFSIAAVKRGERGAILVVDGAVHVAPAEPVDVVDPTGAGDAFDGVLLAGLVRGQEPAVALAAACHAGAQVVSSRETWPQGAAG